MDDVQMWWTRQADLTSWDGTTQNPELPADAISVTEWILHESFDINGMELGLSENYDIALMFCLNQYSTSSHLIYPLPKKTA